MEDKEKFMKEALRRAKKGLGQGEVPVGAVGGLCYNTTMWVQPYKKL